MKRDGSVIGMRAGKRVECKALHAAVWPTVLPSRQGGEDGVFMEEVFDCG